MDQKNSGTTESNNAYEYSKEDFYTKAPYDYLYDLNGFEQQAELEKLSAYAKTKGVNNFKTLWNKYREEKEGPKEKHSKQDENNILAIDGLDKAFNCGNWRVNEDGIFLDGELVCRHPVIPYELIQDLESSDERYRIVYWLNDNDGPLTQHEMVVDYDVLVNPREIIKLAQKGIGIVGGKRASQMTEYFRTMLDRNRPIMRKVKSVTHLGWSRYGTFTPYDDNIFFDGGDGISGSIMKAFKARGDFQTWHDEALKCMKNSLEVRLLMAASTASIFIEKLNALPFFVHLWGMQSGSGKSVATMIAASIWGNPSLNGDYVMTFESTSVAFEVVAAFLCSLPMFIDELQLVNGNRDNSKFSIYKLASGSGRKRSNKDLGINEQRRWYNCFITTGETPIVKESDGEGALNRVIEIEIPSGKKIVEDGNYTSLLVSQNYGFAGKMIIDGITNDGGEMSKEVLQELSEAYKEYTNEFLNDKTTSKQAMAAAMLMIGDMVLRKYVFPEIDELDIHTVMRFLKKSADVDLTMRGYHYVCECVSQNSGKFLHKGQEEAGTEMRGLEAYGMLSHESRGEYAWINKKVWEDFCRQGGFDPKALIKSLAGKDENGYPLAYRRSDGRTCDTTIRINGVPTKCVKIRLPDEEQFRELDSDDPLPF